MNYAEQQEGWTHEYLPAGTCVCFTRPREIGGGFVTVDFASRIFACGYGQPRRHAGSTTYSGKGWRERIVRDAIDHLKIIMTATKEAS